VVIWGGANDINKNETNIGLKHIRNFALDRKHSNVIVMAAPHRYDLHASSCINKEIQIYNRKLRKMMKMVDHAIIVETI
jgi:hypothetical protein